MWVLMNISVEAYLELGVSRRRDRAMKIALPLLFLIILAGLTISSEGMPTTDSNYQLIKIYSDNKELRRQVVAMGFDVIELGRDYLKVFAENDQVHRLEEMGLKTENVPLSEVIDEAVTGKADAGLYHTYDEVVSELHQMELLHSDIVKVFDIGHSIEGRHILAIKISDNPAVEELDEPEVLYMGCHHAREWISVEMPMRLANYLVDSYGTDFNITRLIDETETWIVPIVNPDGLEYSQKVYTMWRKNKRDNNNNNVFDPSYDGVDLNRNYGYKWGYDNVGSSPYPESETYRGKNAFSEPETQAIRSLALQHNFVFAISYHSYGNVIVYPWGYINADTPDDKLFTDVAAGMARFNGYAYGNPKDGVMYNTNGDSDDWLYGNRSTIAYTIEVGSMFIPPETEIETIWLRNKYASLLLLQLAKDPFQIYPSIKVHTDKLSYKAGDTMKVGLNLTNREKATTVAVGIWIDLQGGGKYWIIQEPSATLPEGFSYGNTAWKSYVLPSLSTGNYSWHAIVVDPSTRYRLSESIASWNFNAAG